MAPSCAEGGVLGVLCASVASIMSTEAIKLITGIGDPLLGRLIVFDALEMRYRELPIRRLPNRQPVTALSDYQTFCGLNLPTDAQAVPVPAINVTQLKTLLEQSTPPVLVDVREPNEWDIVHIPGAILMPKSPNIADEIIARFGSDADLVIACRSGARSKVVTQDLLKQGAARVRNLDGGVLAWAKQIDPSLPSY